VLDAEKGRWKLAKTKSKTKSKSGFEIRTVKSKEDRRRPSVFIRLKAEEAFAGHALFEPDVELKNNPWYFEYFSHYDKQANQYVPCAGAKCPFCAANDNPSTRALTVWYFPAAADVKDRLKVFEFNFSTTNDLIDESEDEDGLLGKVVRVKRLNDGGDYKIKVKTGKPLTKKELEKALKLAEEKFPDGLRGIVERQLLAQMERLKALEALDDDDDDDDDDEDEPKTSKRGKAVVDDDDDDEDDEDEDETDDDDDDDDEEDDDEEVSAIEDVEFEILSVSKKKQTIKVEHEGDEITLQGDDDENSVDGFKKGDTVTVSAEYDDDEESWSITSISSGDEDDDDDDDEEETSDDDEEDTAADEIEAGTFTVSKIQEADEIFDLVDDDGTKFKMWIGDGVEVDYDEVKKGTKITVDADKDAEGDWIITSLEIAKVKSTGGKKTGGKKTAKK
jgi:hypothetical protein